MVCERRRTVTVAKEFAESDPDNDESRNLLAQATNNLGVSYFQTKEWDKAGEAFGTAITPLTALVAKHVK